LPAPGQGAIAVVIAEIDNATADIVGSIDHAPSRVATAAERAFLSALQGGCQVPIGALARINGDTLTLAGFVASLDGGVSLRGEDSGSASQPDRIGWRLAASLLQRGAAELLASARTTATAAMEEP
jgi:hydroxymethylbilane synthase